MKKKRILLGLVLSTAFIGAAIGMTSCAGGENPSASTSEPATQSGDQSTGEADPYADYVKISNVEEFLAFRQLENTSKKYVLTADIDLEGVELEASKVYIRGTFDGNGHTIKNANYSENAANKTGILCREIIGGTVKNVKFISCTASIKDETIGIISGMASGNVTISQVEFSACYVSCNNYPGLLTGRISANNSKLVADQITVKNGCRATMSSYGGLLLSDIAGGESVSNPNEIIFKNMDIAGEIKGGNLNGGFISGRIRNNTTFTVENTIIRDAQLSNNQMGLFAGGGTTNGKNVKVNYKNVAVLNTNAGALQSLGDLMAASSLKEGEFLTTYKLENVFLPAGSTLSLGDGSGTIKETSDITLLSSAVTPAWLTETLHLDFTDTWKTEGTDNAKYRLVAASTNVKSADAKLVTIKLATTNAKTRFKNGEEFSADGLVVMATYSDNVQLVLSPEEYDVLSDTYNKTTSGDYTITVKAKEKNASGADVSATYGVKLATQTGIKVNSEFTKLVYAKGEDLNLKNLLVYSVWDDGIDEKLVYDDKNNVHEYTITSTEYDKTTAGGYTISVAMDGFDAKTIKVSVIDSKPTIVDNKVYINVDQSSNIAVEGTKVDGVETFTTITNAIDYLSSINLADNVDKVVYIADGTYTEKITIPATLKNVKFIGESRENTIIAYDAVEGTINPLTESVYKMECATLHVNSEGFGLENITVKNTFDYINEASNYGDPQGFALTIAADGAVLNNVYLYGNQDTLFFKSGRVYIKDSRIDGNVDFIFGENKGLAFFDNCTIHAVYRGDTNNTGYVTAMKGDTGSTKPAYGYIFNNCKFEADSNVNDGSMSLGRPWGGGATVAMINCSFTKAYSTLGYTSDDKTKSRWFSMSGNSPVNADFCEYGSTGEGAITTAVDGGKVLTAEQAANYTAANLFAATNGGVTWDAAFDYAAALTALQGMATKASTTGILLFSEGEKVTTDDFEVFANESADFTVVPTEWNAENKEIQVAVTDATIASYANGKLTGLAVGTTTVTLTQGTVSRTINLTVNDAAQYTVTFVTTGTAVNSQTVFRNKKVEKVTTTKENAVLKGWFTDQAYTTPFDFDTDVVTDDLTLYARFVDWADMYKEDITMYFNGTEGNGVSTFKYDNTVETAGTYYGLTVTGKFKFRTSDTQFNKGVSVSFAVEKNAKVTLDVLDFKDTTYTFKLGDTAITPTVIDGGNNKAKTYIFEVATAGTITITNESTGANCYLTSLKVEYPEVITKSSRIDFGSDGNYTTVSALYDDDANYGQIQAACNQIKGDIVLYVLPEAKISIAGNWSVGYTINGEEVLTSNAGGTDDSKLNYTYTCTNGGKVLIHSVHNNNYFYSITVTYPAKIENDLTISFATGGNGYGTIDGVENTCTCTDNNGDGSAQVKNGTITLDLVAPATITIQGNWAIDFTIGDQEVKSTNAGGSYESTNYTYTATSAGKVVITVGDSGKNYFYSISVKY